MVLANCKSRRHHSLAMREKEIFNLFFKRPFSRGILPICFCLFLTFGPAFAQEADRSASVLSLSEEISSLIFSSDNQSSVGYVLPELAYNQARAGLTGEAMETYQKYKKRRSSKKKHETQNQTTLGEIGTKIALGLHENGESRTAERWIHSVWQDLSKHYLPKEADPDDFFYFWPSKKEVLATAIRLNEEGLSQDVFNYTVETIHSLETKEWRKNAWEQDLLKAKFKAELEFGKKADARKTLEFSAKIKEFQSANWKTDLSYMYAALGEPIEAIRNLEEAASIRADITSLSEDGETWKPRYRFYQARDQAIVARLLWKAGSSVEAERLMEKAIFSTKTTPYDDKFYYQRQIILAAAAMEKFQIIEEQLFAGYSLEDAAIYDNPLYRPALRNLLMSNGRETVKKLTATSEGKIFLAEAEAKMGNYDEAVAIAKPFDQKKGCVSPLSSTRAIAFAIVRTEGIEKAQSWANQCNTNLGKVFALLGIMDHYIGNLPADNEVLFF